MPRGGPPPQRGRGPIQGGRGRPAAFMPNTARGGSSLRGHGSRGSFGPNQNRRGVPGGQFSGGSFRAPRSQHQGPSRPRHDPAQSSPFARKDENRRTLTDFKILGFDIADLAWSWGVAQPAQEPPVQHPLPAPPHISTPPPSRIRIYFHTPVTPDDARPIPSLPLATPSDSRKGKRKKLEDDEPDEEERARPPPPQMRSASEDWLMAAIVEGEDAEAEDERLDVEEKLLEGDEGDEGRLLEGDVDRLHAEDKLHQDRLEGDADRLHVDRLHEDKLHQDKLNVDQETLVTAAQIQPDDPSGIHGDVHMWTPEGGSTTELPDPDTEGPCVQGAPPEPEPVPEHEPTPPSMPAPAPASVPVPVSPAAADDSIASSQPTSLISSVGEHDRDNDADHVVLPDTQVPDPSSVAGAINSLLTAAEDSPLPPNGVDVDVEPEHKDEPEPEHEPEHEHEHEETQTQIDETQEMDHLPEPPASPVTTLGSPTVSVHKPETKAGRVSSANRLSISYAGGNRRLVVDAEVVESLKLYRQEGRIEVVLNIVKDGDDGLKGILVEGLSDVTKSYLPLQAICDDYECDDTLPPFSKAAIPSTITLRVYLDTARPLSEPKWAKSGDVQEWLKSMFGRMFWVAGDAAEGWEKKIHVVDPDPPPTIWTILDGWATNSPAGVLNERQRFLKTHMAETDNILEILLRLVRGERATASYQSGPGISAPSVSGPLLSALAHGSAHGAQQTHVSLAVLAMFRLAVEYAEKAAGERGRKEVEERVGEIVRCLPSHLVYKSLDGIFKEWRVEKKGR